MVKPIRITTEDGKEYTLEFSRKTVSIAEDAGFSLKDISAKPMSSVTTLFHCAFLKNHPYMTSRETERILFEELGGIGNLPEGMIERLMELYAAPFESTTDGLKNVKARVEL